MRTPSACEFARSPSLSAHTTTYRRCVNMNAGCRCIRAMFSASSASIVRCCACSTRAATTPRSSASRRVGGRNATFSDTHSARASASTCCAGRSGGASSSATSPSSIICSTRSKRSVRLCKEEGQHVRDRWALQGLLVERLERVLSTALHGGEHAERRREDVARPERVPAQPRHQVARPLGVFRNGAGRKRRDASCKMSEYKFPSNTKSKQDFLPHGHTSFTPHRVGCMLGSVPKK